MGIWGTQTARPLRKKQNRSDALRPALPVSLLFCLSLCFLIALEFVLRAVWGLKAAFPHFRALLRVGGSESQMSPADSWLSEDRGPARNTQCRPDPATPLNTTCFFCLVWFCALSTLVFSLMTNKAFPLEDVECGKSVAIARCHCLVLHFRHLNGLSLNFLQLFQEIKSF